MNLGRLSEHSVSLSLSDLYLRYRFVPSIIDIQAAVPTGTTDRIMQNFPVSRYVARCVLAALSTHLGQHFNLSNVIVNLTDVEQ